ncbi:MAG: hypothetical protein ACOYK9_04560 [Chlamydiia bacterium]
MATVVFTSPQGMWDQAIERIENFGLMGFGRKFQWMGPDESVYQAIADFYLKNPIKALHISGNDDLENLSPLFIDGLKFDPRTADSVINDPEHNFVCLDPRILGKFFDSYPVSENIKIEAVIRLISKGQIPPTDSYKTQFLEKFSKNAEVKTAIEKRDHLWKQRLEVYASEKPPC